MKASLLARALPAAAIFVGLAGAPLAGSLAQTSSTSPTPATGASTPGAPTANSPMGSQSATPPNGAPAASSSAAAPSAAAPSAATATKAPSRTTAASHAGGTTTAPKQSIRALVDRRITDLHGRLHITAAQQPKWDAFAQTMRGNAEDLDAAYRQRAEKLDKMNAVDNMQSYAQIEQKRAQDAEKLIPAFQSLYSSLSETQKKEADSLFRNYAAQAQKRHAAGAQTGSR